MGSGKPVIALMGEFSAGKSTLANLLIGAGVSPVKVTATQLPPVWFSYGSGNPVVVDLDGNETEIAIEDLESVSVQSTEYVRIYADAEILAVMDIMDMPGNSDPNMSSDVWARALHHATGVIWCTHSNQAWRQSEAAVWEEMPVELYANSILLMTRFDKITGERDRKRLLHRVRTETEGLFRDVCPIALLDAQNAGDDREKWQASGAEAFVQQLLDVVMDPAPVSHGQYVAAETAPGSGEVEPEPAPEANGGVIPRRVQRRNTEENVRPRTPRPTA